MLEIGTLIDGKYKVLNKIGQGGMSVVYLAMNEKANKQWAIKEVRKEGIENFEVVRQGLIGETNLLKELKHSHLPSIADIIETEGTLLIVMDYVEGRALSAVMNEEGIQPQETVVDWAIQLCDVLEYLHTQEQPIIYRDMKPANIMLKPDGNVVLIDFGTARKYKEHNLLDTTCLGTMGYAAPEQFGGESQRQTDARTDIYNLGATVYHLLTGHNPSEPPYEIYPIRCWNPALSTGLEKIVEKCVQKNPDDRFQSCGELREALTHYRELDDSYIKKQKRKIALFLTCFLLCFAGIVCGSYGLLGIRQEVKESYSACLTEATLRIAISPDSMEIDPEVIGFYQKAINIEPFRSEAYNQLLDYYLSKGKGQTRNGLMLLSAMISSGKGNLMQNSDVLMKMAEVYFSGNNRDTDFVPDYAAAYQYFSLVDKKEYPQAQYYMSIAESLSSLNIDWGVMMENLLQAEQYVDQMLSVEDRIQDYLMLANVYRGNAPNLQVMDARPFDRAMELLSKAEALMLDAYTDSAQLERYQPDILIAVADTSYRQGNIENDKKLMAEYYDRAITYYQNYLSFIPEKDRVVYENKIGDIYRGKKSYREAAGQYQSIIDRYPNNLTAYISYATMALIDQKNIEQSKMIYEQAGQIPGAQSDANYQSLEKKLRNAGAL